jgi:hypothetical protein
LKLLSQILLSTKAVNDINNSCVTQGTANSRRVQKNVPMMKKNHFPHY